MIYGEILLHKEVCSSKRGHKEETLSSSSSVCFANLGKDEGASIYNTSWIGGEREGYIATKGGLHASRADCPSSYLDCSGNGRMI